MSWQEELGNFHRQQKPCEPKSFRARRPTLIEGYRARVVQYGVNVCEKEIGVYRFRTRCHVTAQYRFTQDDDAWGQQKLRRLTAQEWSEFIERLNNSAFWDLPYDVPSPGCLDGERFRLQGYKSGSYHELYRDSASMTPPLYLLFRQFEELARRENVNAI